MSDERLACGCPKRLYDGTGRVFVPADKDELVEMILSTTSIALRNKLIRALELIDAEAADEHR